MHRTLSASNNTTNANRKEVVCPLDPSVGERKAEMVKEFNAYTRHKAYAICCIASLEAGIVGLAIVEFSVAFCRR